MKSIKELLEFSIINLDKPTGPTSYQVSDYVREKLGARKTSHLGTLDPAVTGVLPIALNRACRLATYLMKKDKTYVGIMRLHEAVSDLALKKAMKEMTGDIVQLPPLRSSVKRAERTRTVARFDFLERDGKDVLFCAEVEAGTYIRTLVHDLGKKIGGAHMLELRRVQAGTFSEEKSISLYTFEQAMNALKEGDESPLRAILIPAEDVVREALPSIEIKKTNLTKILTGKPIHTKDLAKKIALNVGTYVAVFCGKRLVEIARIVNEGEVVAVPDFVLN